LKIGKPFSNAKYYTLNDSGKYCEGKLKSQWLTREIDLESVSLEAQRGK